MDPVDAWALLQATIQALASALGDSPPVTGDGLFAGVDTSIVAGSPEPWRFGGDRDAAVAAAVRAAAHDPAGWNASPEWLDATQRP